MNVQIVATLISEGSKLIGQYLRGRPIHIEAVQKPQTVEMPQPTFLEKPQVSIEEKATSVSTGCVPCAIGHFGTCSGLLAEGMRFARDDGIGSEEVIDRVGQCLEELNAMERVDLAPEKIVTLPDWEKELAEQALSASRQTRHALESYDSVTSLEQAAAQAQSTRTLIWRNYIKQKMKHLTSEEQEKIQRKVIEKLEELQEGEE